MNLQRLEYFVAVVDAGSVSRASVILDVSQPALSRQIALLEEEVGHRLLTRHGRGINLPKRDMPCLGMHEACLMGWHERAQICANVI